MREVILKHLALPNPKELKCERVRTYLEHICGICRLLPIPNFSKDVTW